MHGDQKLGIPLHFFSPVDVLRGIVSPGHLLVSHGVGPSLRSARTVLENTILTAVSTVVLTVVPTGTVSVIVLGQRPNRQGTG